MDEKICCICGKRYVGEGHNARPVDDGLCCRDCNGTIVIPQRIMTAKPRRPK